MTVLAPVGSLDAFEPVTLDELERGVSLQTRVDRKYVLDAGRLDALLGRLPDSTRVLEIDDRREFTYETLYFDTPGLVSYLDAARRRPRRFKVRTRDYPDTGTRWLEVKLRDTRGRTVKHRALHDGAHAGDLTDASVAFLERFAAIRPLAPVLRPTLTTRYRRTTLAIGTTRVTLDATLTCTDAGGRSTGPRDTVVVETKTLGAAGEVDRLLWALRARPTDFSKYGIGMAVLHEHLPRNKWHRAIARLVWDVAPT